jgi:hypothetical protein
VSERLTFNKKMIMSMNSERVEELVEGLDAMLDHMRTDYKSWSDSSNARNPERVRDENGETVSDRMCREYCASLEYSMGKKYVKVTDGRSVKAFVVACDNDKKFEYGDILKPAGWKTPARNFRRGNVLDRSFGAVRWTGA